ncbi:LysR family transcriptional regulator [Actinacidiphila sp. bgisy167]|uniref:LysR family transcriptional regulator n=1 Tax=Actinacidiphila sp. bgisy167 TaxID=3413797 RepID=UPI003D714232
MTLSLPGLRAFVAVARTGSFSAAARRLDVRQPTVSESVRRLEAAAGRPLLVRNRERAELTDLGRRILAHAVAAVDAADELEGLLAGTAPRPFTVGFLGEAAAGRTRELLDLIQARVRGEVRLRRYDFDDPSCGLLDGRCDLGIVWPPLDAPGLGMVTVADDRRCVALPATDPLARRTEVAPAELGGRTWVVPRTADAAYAGFRHPSAVGVVHVAGTVPSGSLEETLELVAAGRCCALASTSTDEHYARSNVVFVPLAGDVRCTVALAWRAADRRPAVRGAVEDAARLFGKAPPGAGRSAADEGGAAWDDCTSSTWTGR